MPKLIGPVTANKWEREVRRQFLTQLPQDWIVVCNVAWSTRDESGYVHDGQSDFVVLAPGHGMVIAEVKGSKQVRVGNDGIWYIQPYSAKGAPDQGEVPLDTPPPDQATRNMHELERLVTKALRWGSFKGAFAYVIIYPNGEVSSPTALLDPTTIITKQHMNTLASHLRASLAARGSEHNRQSFDVSRCKEVADVLSKNGFIVSAVDTGHEVRDDDNLIDKLTRQQFAALKGAFELKRVAILGPAGAGKTVLAIWKLKALIEEGKRAIYVCFNKALAEFLRVRNPEYAEFIKNVDKLFYDIAKPRVVPAEQGTFFSEQLPDQVSDAVLTMRDDEKFEAIIIDEGQDFGDSRLYALYQLLRNDDSQWLFLADWSQDVYQQHSDTPLGAEVIFNLYHNCRNTQRVTDSTNSYCRMSVLPMPDCPKGERPLLEHRGTNDLMAARAWEIIHELMPLGGAVILSPYKLENSCMTYNRKAYGLALTEDLSKLGESGHVFFSTIRSFKGLEASLVVLVQAEQPSTKSFLSLEDLYVACTRPKSRLAIITGNESSLKWFESQLH